MTGYQTNLLTGVAQLLAAASVGTWNPTGVYASSDKAIVLKTIPETPDTIIALATYPVTSDPALSDSVTGLQVLTRAAGQDPRTVDDLADLIFDQLQGLHDVTLGTGVRLVQCLHHGGGSLGEDSLHRWSRSDNYYITSHRPSLNRT
jgi:hypothetical protein